MKYIIVFLLRGKAKSKILRLRNKISNRFGVHEALKYPPHITLKYPFETSDINEVMVFLQEFSNKCKKFEFKINDFSHFEKKCWFVKINDSGRIFKIRKSIVKGIKEVGGISADKKDLNLPPHLTLAYKDIKKQFQAIGRFLRKESISEEVKFDNITILKHSNNKWKTYRLFQLSF